MDQGTTALFRNFLFPMHTKQSPILPVVVTLSCIKNHISECTGSTTGDADYRAEFRLAVAPVSSFLTWPHPLPLTTPSICLHQAAQWTKTASIVCVVMWKSVSFTKRHVFLSIVFLCGWSVCTEFTVCLFCHLPLLSSSLLSFLILILRSNTQTNILIQTCTTADMNAYWHGTKWAIINPCKPCQTLLSLAHTIWLHGCDWPVCIHTPVYTQTHTRMHT